MQFTALTYLIGVMLSHSEAQSSLNMGLLGAAQMVPVLVLGPIGGFAADRFPRRPCGSSGVNRSGLVADRRHGVDHTRDAVNASNIFTRSSANHARIGTSSSALAR